jgi:hypothetical protein
MDDFDPKTGAFPGALADLNGNTIVISGLWDLFSARPPLGYWILTVTDGLLPIELSNTTVREPTAAESPETLNV